MLILIDIPTARVIVSASGHRKIAGGEVIYRRTATVTGRTPTDAPTRALAPDRFSSSDGRLCEAALHGGQARREPSPDRRSKQAGPRVSSRATRPRHTERPTPT